MLALAVLFLVTACGVAGYLPATDVEPHPAGLLETTETPVSGLIPVSNHETVPEAPEAFAVALVEMADERDWASVKELLVEGFEDLDAEAIGFGLSAGSLTQFWLGGERPEQWHTEPFGDAVIVRVTEFPTFALTLRRAADGTWRLDPGPLALGMTKLRQQAPDDFGWSVRGPRVDLLTDESLSWISRRFSQQVSHTLVEQDRAIVTITFTLVRGDEVRIPLEGLSYLAGRTAGRPEVVWTTAVVDNDALLLPSYRGGGATRYYVSFAMEGAAAVETVELQINEITVDGGVLSLHYQIPTEDFPQLSESAV
ncbi:MAG: hypothetical protein IIC95_09345 [Chloroflexi bacterium]|nr:hypothetical protein [Chloroflexota bacterium]